MKPLKTHDTYEVEQYMKKKQKILTMNSIGKVFGKGYMKSATMSTAVNVFWKTGSYPVDKDIYNKADFIADHLELDGTSSQPTDDTGSDGNIVDKYQYVSIFLDIESIDMKTKISINIEKRNVMKKW